MIEYFNIKDKSVIEDLTMLIKSKKYEIIIKSIIYFFDIFIKKIKITYQYKFIPIKIRKT